ncbi:BTAD domain-containing putative transcriptional regulator [Bacillus songklensis]|uniref:BTAD domain-containing putative transcriptional regulator n=1 Tax=Bacillus songklensis TaxID=1069116 RepID=A0ABV8B066_9BACI
MPPKTYIIETKISPPDLKEPILQRPQLMKKMQQVLRHPLTIIHCGPGYGKSAALVSFIHSATVTYGWYMLDMNDCNLLPFLRYITCSLRKQIPNFGEQLLTYIHDPDHYLHEEDIHFLCALFINEVSAYGQNVLLVLDDVHHILPSIDIQRWIQWLLEHQPSNLFLVLSSRIKINWAFLSSLKVKKQVLEINQEDLAFTKEEIEVLVNDYYHYPLCSADIEVISNVTEGWILAVQMISQQLSKADHGVEFLQNKNSLEELFSFLAMEVFMNQPLETQEFLVKTSIFERIDPSLCRHVLNIPDALPILEDLQSRNLFLLMDGKNQFRYHALFKELLETHLKKNPLLYTELNIHAAVYFLQQQQYWQALQHYKAIDEYEQMALLLGKHGEIMLEKGYLHQLKEMVEQIPDSIKDQYYLVWYYEGEANRYYCIYQKAEECYKKAEKIACASGDINGEGKAAEGQAKIYLDTIQPGKAERFLKRAITCVEKSSTSSVKERARLYYLMAENLVNAGRASEARKWYEKGKTMNLELNDTSLEIRLKLRTGKLEEARKKLIEKERDSNGLVLHLQQSHRENVLLLSLIEAWIGNAEEAKRLADDGIKQGIHVKAPFLEACGWIRIGHAVQLLERYNPELAQKCYETALEMMDELLVSKGKAEALMGLCLLHGFAGFYETAIHQGKKALKETELVKDAWLSGLIQLCMGIAAIHNKQWKEGNEFLMKARQLFVECGDDYGQTLVYMWRTFTDYECGQWEGFEQSLSSFWKLIEQGNYEYLLFKRTMFGPRDLKRFVPILLEGQRRHIHEEQMIRLLEKCGIGDALNHPGYTLRIQTFGSFRVWLGDREIQDRDWQRAKAKELLELFVTNRHTLLQKEEIIASLWADVEEGTALRDLKVALNALNNVLEPNRKARSNTFYIRRIESSYGLNEQADYEIDAVEFEKWVYLGLEEGNEKKAMRFLQKGLAIYKGEYLANRRYEDWCIHEKERLRLYFLRGAEKLARLLMDEKQYDQAIHWCEKILEQDVVWEEAYRLLMICYTKKNNRPQALKVYRKCCEQLKKELEIKPMAKTEQVHEMIKNM